MSEVRGGDHHHVDLGSQALGACNRAAAAKRLVIGVRRNYQDPGVDEEGIGDGMNRHGESWRGEDRRGEDRMREGWRLRGCAGG